MQENPKKKTENSFTFCPFQLLKEYVCVRGPYKSIDEPFFVFSDNSPVRPEAIHNCLKKTLAKCGFDCTLYDTHSL